MSVYKCDICNFITDDRYNFYVHIETQKHKKLENYNLSQTSLKVNNENIISLQNQNDQLFDQCRKLIDIIKDSNKTICETTMSLKYARKIINSLTDNTKQKIKLLEYTPREVM